MQLVEKKLKLYNTLPTYEQQIIRRFMVFKIKKENENMKKKRKISGQARAFIKSLHKNGNAVTLWSQNLKGEINKIINNLTLPTTSKSLVHS